MRTEQEIRLRCPKCNHLRKGFSLSDNGRAVWFTSEKVCFTMQCMDCRHEFYTYFTFSEIREMHR